METPNLKIWWGVAIVNVVNINRLYATERWCLIRCLIGELSPSACEELGLSLHRLFRVTLSVVYLSVSMQTAGYCL
jgi:hypothetical protein